MSVTVTRAVKGSQLTSNEVDGNFGALAAPGGRLTLTSGTPVTTSDVTGATSIYYAPFASTLIPLYNGTIWQLVEFAETTLALGTLTASLPYDVFAYVSANALVLELLAWTNDTTRATAITIQDGRYCKSGDKTRLYLGTFRTTATTTTEDSNLHRFLFNAYNRRARNLVMDNAASHSYNGGYREWNGGTSRVDFCIGLAENIIAMGVTGEGTPGSTSYCIMAQNMDVTNNFDAYFYASQNAIAFGAGAPSTYSPAVGFHFIAALESTVSIAASTFTHVHLCGSVIA
jgi:hypothetical protein